MDNEGQVECSAGNADTQNPKRKVSWEEFGVCVKLWLPRIPRYDVYVGIANGGLVLASILAKINDSHLSVMRFRHYDGEQKRKEVEYKGFWGLLAGRVLLVDDIADTGDTLAKALKIIDGADTLTMFQKTASRVKPTYIWERTDQWICFPWEVGEYET